MPNRYRSCLMLAFAYVLSATGASAQDDTGPEVEEGTTPTVDAVPGGLLAPGDVVGPTNDAAPTDDAAPSEDASPADDAATTDGSYARPALERGAVEGQLQPLLDKHAFCRKKDYRLPIHERELCNLSEAAKNRCPAIAEACRVATPEPPRERRSFDGLDMSLVSLFRTLVWVIVIGGLALVVFSLLKRLLAVKDTDDEAESKAEADATEIDEAAAPATLAVETDVDRLLARARQAAARGDFAGAVRDAYAALLRKLDRDGLIEVHRSKTNGDYRRSLSHTPVVQAEFASIVRTVESIQFGSEQPSEQVFQSVWQKVLTLAGRSVSIALLLAAAFSSTACDEFDREPMASALGCGETPGGYSVLCELVAAHSTSIKRRIRQIDKIDENVDKIIVLDEALLNGDEWQVIDDWVKAGHTLVLASVSNPLSESLEISLASARCTTPAAVDNTVQASYGTPIKLATSPHGMALKADTSWVLSACDAGPTLVGKAHGEGNVLVLPNSQFLTNVSLAAADNAYFAANVIARDSVNVEVVGEWTGSGSESPLDAMNSAHLTPWLLQLLVVAALLGLWKGPHFGLPRDPVSSKRHAFVEHIQALGLKYARSKASGYVLNHYGAWALSRLFERVLPGARATVSELSAALAESTGRAESDVLKILIAAKSAQDEAHDTATAEEHLKTMRELESLLKAAGGTR